MTDEDDGRSEMPEVPSEMIAKAAELLSTGEGLTSFLVGRVGSGEERASPGRRPRLAAISVVGGRHGSEVVKVPLDVPVGELGGVFGEGAGGDAGRSVLLRSGQVVLPHQTLGEMGVGPGSTLLVGEPPAHVAEPALGYGGPRAYRAGRHPERRGNRAFSGVVAGAAAVGIFLAGGAVIGGGQEAPPPGTAKLAQAAAQAWLSGKPFSGPTRGDVGALLDRAGPALEGSLEPAGSWSAPGLFSEQFLVGSPAGTYGLSVVVYRGYLVYPPTPSPLPYVEPAGARVPETGTWVKTNVAPTVENWAKATFAPTGALRPAELALAGKTQVLDEWRPRSGASLVARVEVPLAGTDGSATASGVYDAAFDRQGNIVAWAPAEYGS